MVGDNLAHSHDCRKFVLDDQGVHAYLVFTVGVGIQSVDEVLVCIDSTRQVYLDVGLVGGVVGDRCNLELACLRSLGDGVDHHLAGHSIREFLYDNPLRI